MAGDSRASAPDSRRHSAACFTGPVCSACGALAEVVNVSAKLQGSASYQRKARPSSWEGAFGKL